MLLPPKLSTYAIVKELYRRGGFQTSPYKLFGGGERVRTDDPLRARQVLSQLSYTPKITLRFRLRLSKAFLNLNLSLNLLLIVVGLDGLEPSTSRLSVVCSSQLSYRPIPWLTKRKPFMVLVIANQFIS